MGKLLQINPVIRENTSTGRIMRMIGDYAMSHGWESYIAYSKGRDGVPEHSSQLIPIGNKWDVALHWLATRLFDAHGLASKKATRAFIKEIQRINPDVIHIHNIHGYFLNYPLLFKYLQASGKPVVWTTHDCWLYTGHCYHYDAVKCQRWKTLCHHCPQKRAFPSSWLLDGSSRNYRAKQTAFCSLQNLTLVNVSNWMRNQMQESFLKDKHFSLVRNGIDLQVFTPKERPSVLRKYRVDASKIILLAITSVWTAEKGLEDLIWLSKHIPSNQQLVLVGKMNQSQSESVPRGVITIGRTESMKELVALYSAAGVLVNPTYQDNYPTVNMEALACGTPVVTYQTGGSTEMLGPQTGFAVPQGNRDALLVATQKALTLNRESCVLWARAHFDQNKSWNRYLQLYNKLITEKKTL